MIERQVIAPRADRIDRITDALIVVLFVAAGVLCILLGRLYEVGRRPIDAHASAPTVKAGDCRHFDVYAHIGDGWFYTPPRACERRDTSMEYGVYIHFDPYDARISWEMPPAELPY